jgi:hypothetical protein
MGEVGAGGGGRRATMDAADMAWESVCGGVDGGRRLSLYMWLRSCLAHRHVIPREARKVAGTVPALALEAAVRGKKEGRRRDGTVRSR